MKLGRRLFLGGGLTLGGGLSAFWPFPSKKPTIAFTLKGARKDLGHRLIWKDFPPPLVSEEKYHVVVVGAGVAGLAATRKLAQSGINDVLVVDLERASGGNALSGRKGEQAFPWGAHYLPAPDTSQRSLLSFLEELKVVTGYKQGRAVFDEAYLCHAPQERLLFGGKWIYGLVPYEHLSESERQKVDQFYKLMKTLRLAKGRDGRLAFSIPVANSSTDPVFREWDKISFDSWLQQRGLSCPYLDWLLDYCCRDDFGVARKYVSAWAGIHYFASRRVYGEDGEGQEILTWPEGNKFLVRGLSHSLKSKLQVNTCAYQITQTQSQVETLLFDVNTSTSRKVSSKAVIFAGPQFVAGRVIGGYADKRKNLYQDDKYQPWLIANLHLENVPNSFLPAWDNVAYQGESLGYIFSGHQLLKTQHENMTLTLYWPWKGDASSERGSLFLKTEDELGEMVIKEFLTMHPELESNIVACDLWLWAHGMIAPYPDTIWGETRRKLRSPFGRIHFAHSDLSGISIFEEAFYQGERAAQEVKESLNGELS